MRLWYVPLDSWFYTEWGDKRKWRTKILDQSELEPTPGTENVGLSIWAIYNWTCYAARALPFKNFSGLRPKPRWGAPHPPVTHLQSTFIRGWLRPCYVMDRSLLTFLRIAPVECPSTAAMRWHAAKGDWPSGGTTRSGTSPQISAKYARTSKLSRDFSPSAVNSFSMRVPTETPKIASTSRPAAFGVGCLSVHFLMSGV